MSTRNLEIRIRVEWKKNEDENANRKEGDIMRMWYHNARSHIKLIKIDTM